MAEIAIVPLLTTFDPNPYIMPFSVMLSHGSTKIPDPIKASNFTRAMSHLVVSKAGVEKAQLSGFPYSVAMELLERWFFNLDLGPDGRIVPVGFCYPLTMMSLVKWMGYITYSEMFTTGYYDAQSTVMMNSFHANNPCSLMMAGPSLRTVVNAAGLEWYGFEDCMTVAVTVAKVMKTNLLRAIVLERGNNE